jgi:hypothetical protein
VGFFLLAEELAASYEEPRSMQSLSCLLHNKQFIDTQPNVLPYYEQQTIQSVAPTPHTVHCTFHCTLSVGTVKGCCAVHFVLCSVSSIRSINTVAVNSVAL